MPYRLNTNFSYKQYTCKYFKETQFGIWYLKELSEVVDEMNKIMFTQLRVFSIDSLKISCKNWITLTDKGTVYNIFNIVGKVYYVETCIRDYLHTEFDI